jgi:FkbM family methyltransferase
MPMWFEPFYRPPLKHLYRLFTEPAYRTTCYASFRYGRLPAKQQTRVSVGRLQMTVPDAPSFLSAYRGIVLDRMYDFKTDQATPYILDVGANVGVSVLWFKERFPRAKVVAFEADPVIFRYLKENLSANNVDDVELIQKAVWTTEDWINFESEGADAGRIGSATARDSVLVQSTRLRPWLERAPVDFLKLDIEGAEVDVIADCRDLLPNVQNMYIEHHSRLGAPQRLGEMLDICEKAGFRVYVDSLSPMRTPFLRTHVYSGMDAQVHVFCRRSEPEANVS